MNFSKNFSNYRFSFQRIINYNLKEFRKYTIIILKITLLINNFVNINYINKRFKVLINQIFQLYQHFDNLFKLSKN